MKIFICSSLFLFSLPTLALSQSLLLDASCKVNCLVNITEIESEQGEPSYNRQYDKTFTDILGITREQIDKKTQAVELDRLCKKAFSEKAVSEGVDCLYFKH